MKLATSIFILLSLSFASCNKCVPTAAKIFKDEIAFCDSYVVLVGSQPKADEEGKWEIINGSNGSFTTINEPVTHLHRTTDSVVFVKWSILGPCGNSSDSSLIHFRFSCGDQLVYAGNRYSTVLIGNQCWFSENLNVGQIISGNNNQNNNQIIEKYCYLNDSLKCDTFGGLYQWAEAIQYQGGSNNNAALLTPLTGFIQGICPNGWHIPNDGEWSTMEGYLGGPGNAGGKLKSTSSLWNSPNLGATNESKFTALPSGFRLDNGTFSQLSNNTWFWSSTEWSNLSLGRSLSATNDDVTHFNDMKINGYSIRCVKN